MTDEEAVEMMNRCVSEMTALRRQVEILAPKADAYDNIATVLRLLPQPGRVCGDDLVWLLKKRIEEMTPKNPAEPAHD